MARRRARGQTAPPQIKPWHRVLAFVVLLASIGIAVYALHDLGPTPASWSKHIGGALFSLFLGFGFGASIAVPKVALWFFAVAGWTLGVAFIWIGIEHFLDWIAFYDGRGRNKVTTPTGAAVQGGFVIALGTVLLAVYLFAIRETILRRRDPSRATVAERITKRSKK